MVPHRTVELPVLAAFDLYCLARLGHLVLFVCSHQIPNSQSFAFMIDERSLPLSRIASFLTQRCAVHIVAPPKKRIHNLKGRAPRNTCFP